MLRRLTEEDLALLEVIEDPIWCGEFLRNTVDGSTIKEEWPKYKFRYRWYQKDILTDQSPKIVVRGGRAVGKCSPGRERIYTDMGYRTIRDLHENTPAFSVFTLNKDGEFVRARAAVKFDGVKKVYRVTTSSGRVFEATKNHPMFTQRGFVEIQNLNMETDQVAVANYVPFPSTLDEFNWYELRYLGYIYAQRQRVAPSIPIKIKYKRQALELQLIAKKFAATFSQPSADTVTILRNFAHPRHYGTDLIYEILESKIKHVRNTATDYKKRASRLPDRLMRQSLKSLKIFMESFLSGVAEISEDGIYIKSSSPELIKDCEEVFLRFGISSRTAKRPIEEHDHESVFDLHACKNICELFIERKEDIRRFFNVFKIPGITAITTELPDQEPLRFESITSIEELLDERVYAIHVRNHNTYISSGFFVHNSILLEDMLVYESLNPDLEFPENQEQLLTTANVSQLTPVLDRYITRLLGGKLLSGLQSVPNKAKGTIDVPFGNRSLRTFARIAGQRGETNLVGLHVTKIKVDEAQLFPWSAYQQMLPTLNTWQKRTQLILFGVPNGVTTGNVLWTLDQVSKAFKKYRIPAHENPFFSRRDNSEALTQFGGETSDDYLQLVLGYHGNPSFTIIPRESIRTEPFEIYSYRFSATEKEQGYQYSDFLKTPSISERYTCGGVLFAIDTGFTDPTIIQVLGADENMTWRTLLRYRLTRIPFPEQAAIIDYLNREYNPNVIGIDFGAGGGGVAIAQMLQNPDSYPLLAHDYLKKIKGVRFSDLISIGVDGAGKPLQLMVKSFAGNQLAKLVSEKELVFSEIDQEGISQLERIAFQRRTDGSMRFYVLSDKGGGESTDDHIFASYVVFVYLLTSEEYGLRIKRTKLFGARWI